MDKDGIVIVVELDVIKVLLLKAMVGVFMYRLVAQMITDPQQPG